MHEDRDAAFRKWEPTKLELWNNPKLSRTTVAKEAWNAAWAAAQKKTPKQIDEENGLYLDD